MRALYHLPLSPYCRKIRLILAEKRLDFELQIEKPWDARPEFAHINPAGTVPVLVEETGLVIPDSVVIAEYLEEAYPEVNLLGNTLAERVEARRLAAWFDGKFAEDTSRGLLGEKYLKRMSGQGHPNGSALRTAYLNLRTHMEYIGWLADNRRWLAGDHLSIADFAAAAHLSALDFIGDVEWSVSSGARDWYAKVKSRPCFRGLLQDTVPGFLPPKHYADLDF